MSLLIETIRHTFGPKTVLQDISLQVASGEVVCLLGPSGCGKTTLLRLIAGLEELQHGRILIDDQVIAEPRRQMLPERRGTGFLFQDFALFPHLTVLENTMFGLAQRSSKAERRAKALDALEQVDMQDYAAVYPHELSGGQQQRVALARALAPSPRIMLLDEPFSSLDTRLRAQIRDQTLHVLKSTGVATVMVTHDPEEAMFMGDRIILMHQGHIVQTGSPAELYAHPVNAFVTTFFSDVNALSGTVEAGAVQTKFGTIKTNGLPDGSVVDILFRPDAVSVRNGHGALSSHRGETAPNGYQAASGSVSNIAEDRGERPLENLIEADVLTTRLLPGATLVHLRIPVNGHSDTPDLHLHARVPCVSPMPEGTKVQVHVPLDQIYVFPKS
ncbi:ABC transporter ATP-binding protein [Desulfonatronum thioautotrophicum]|uniref:ABC transporter ATP-binding protein n=1 Tax=Desulfonatronum thioautotrophicum TaxID=617001 RepID=UPI0005EBBBE9|nr:ABC transporter ATP-binding protein [Desulfonatronum thioautotrophicum]